MKFLYPSLVAFLLGACAFAPEDKEAAHQRKLWEEARANFIAVGGRESSQPAPPPPPVPPAPAPPTPKPHILAFPQSPSSGVTESAPTPPPHHWFAVFATQPKPKPQPTPPRNPDDTVYYWQVPPAGRTASPREQAAEAKYARQLAKRPEDLTPEERLYAHEHY